MPSLLGMCLQLICCHWADSVAKKNVEVKTMPDKSRWVRKKPLCFPVNIQAGICKWCFLSILTLEIGLNKSSASAVCRLMKKCVSKNTVMCEQSRKEPKEIILVFDVHGKDSKRWIQNSWRSARTNEILKHIFVKAVPAKGSSHKDFKKQEATHEESKNTKMEMEWRCVENQMGQSGEELPERMFCRGELHRVGGQRGRSLKIYLKKELLRKGCSKNQVGWGAGEAWRGGREEQVGGVGSQEEIHEHQERGTPANRAAAGGLLQVSFTLILVSLGMNNGKRWTWKTKQIE